jgi:hypothetical protein
MAREDETYLMFVFIHSAFWDGCYSSKFEVPTGGRDTVVSLPAAPGSTGTVRIFVSTEHVSRGLNVFDVR